MQKQLQSVSRELCMCQRQLLWTVCLGFKVRDSAFFSLQHFSIWVTQTWAQSRPLILVWICIC